MTADTLASYGSLARFRTEERIKPLGDNIMIGAAGDISDFQWMMKHLEEVKYKFFFFFKFASSLMKVSNIQKNKDNG